MNRAEAINIIRDARCTSPLRDALEALIPELAESEDERIRKGIVETIKQCPDTFLNPKNRDKMLAYLEKQKEQKPVQEIEPTPIFRIGDILKRKGKDYTFRVDRIQGGYYHCNHNHGAFFPIEEQSNWELVEQKPAEWSDEDDQLIGFIFDLLNDLVWRKDWAMSKKECLERLKSLRPSWKLSEDEERLINTSISFLKDFADKGYENAVECIDWLKSKLNGNSGK